MLNNMMAIGNVGTDSEMRYTVNRTSVTSFRLAVGHKYKTSDGEANEAMEWAVKVANLLNSKNPDANLQVLRPLSGPLFEVR